MSKSSSEVEESKYYNPIALEVLSSEICGLTDTIKYLFSLAPEDEDYSILTPQLNKAFESAVAASEDLQSAYNYYRSKRKNL